MSYLEPALPLLLVFGIAGLVKVWRRSGKGRKPWLLTISLAGILLLSMNVSAWIISLPLQIWYDESRIPDRCAEAIVILSGTVYSPTRMRPYGVAAPDTYERLQHGVWLFKHWNSLPILVCGGTFNHDEPYSAAMKRLLESENVPSEFIWVESRSRSTHESAVYGSEILRQHGVSRIALVVEATGMPRAAASFRKAGIHVIPAPMRFIHLRRNLMDLVPNWRAIAMTDETIHELVGLAWYRLRGWI